MAVHIIRSIINAPSNFEIKFDEHNPPNIFFDTNVWRSMNDIDIAALQRLQQKYGFRYRYSVTNFIELASHLEDQPSKDCRDPFRVFQSCFQRIRKVCEPEILQAPETVFLARAGLAHYIHPAWIPNVNEIALKVEFITNVNSPNELTNIDVGHYRNLRIIDKNSMKTIMEELQVFRRPITRSDYNRLLEWFKILAGFFLFVRPTDAKIALKDLLSGEQNQFRRALIGGIGQLFMTHCMHIVKQTINDGKSVDPNDLYDMLQLILLEDDNSLFVTREKVFFKYQINPDNPQRVLPWIGFVSIV